MCEDLTVKTISLWVLTGYLQQVTPRKWWVFYTLIYHTALEKSLLIRRGATGDGAEVNVEVLFAAV